MPDAFMPTYLQGVITLGEVVIGPSLGYRFFMRSWWAFGFGRGFVTMLVAFLKSVVS